MQTVIKSAMAAAALIVSAQAAANITFYEREAFRGRTFATGQPVNDLERSRLNNRASSAVVTGQNFEVCDDVRFGGRCTVLRPGRYSTLSEMGLNDPVSSVRVAKREAAPVADAGTPGQITFYERENFHGQTFATEQQVRNLAESGFNDRASSAVVLGERWEVCADARFNGQCMVLRPGRYPSLSAMGMNDRISSVREVARNARIDEGRYSAAPVPAYDNRRRGNERVYEANVTSSRVVVATPEKRCWVEQGHAQEKSGYNIPGAVIGAVVGGVLGHQVGGGNGNTIATVGGLAGGAAIGANVGRTNQAATQDVQRCETVPNQTQADYWDVTYNFRGQEHRVQMTTQPGATVTVNQQGEPRA